MRPLLVLTLAFTTCFALAQKKDPSKESPFKKFGKITPEVLQTKVYPLDSSANAVVLSDIGEAAIEGNSKGWFSILYKRHRVVHILNKNGYDYANVEIPLYRDGDDEEKLMSIKAVTYNLEGGKVVEAKLERSGVFKENISKNRFTQKFTFPNVKEGSIIEYEYTVSSDYISQLDPWFFQSTCPTIWSEFKFSVPEFYAYSFLGRGYHPVFINEKSDRKENFTVRDTRGAGATETSSFGAGVTDYRWAMVDIPALKTEPFTYSTANHRSRIEFQLVSQSQPLTPRDFRTNWPTFIRSMMESEYFGKAIGSNNGWLEDDIKPVASGNASELHRAVNIYNYVRNNFSVTSAGPIYLTQSLKSIMKARKGAVSDINLLLVAMLRYAGIKADPVILSTTHHGYAPEAFPMTNNYNYVIVQCKADGKNFYLDATQPLLGFGRLLPFCFNGHARVINDFGDPIYLRADSLLESKTSFLMVSNTDKGQWQGSMNQVPGYFESYSIRSKVKESGKEAFFKKKEKEMGIDVKINDMQIDSLSKLEQPVKIQYSFDVNTENADILYINPMFGHGYDKNPFSSANRYYPVEMPYTKDETFILNMEVPKGYVVDELPKQMLAKFDEEGKTFFEYRIALSGDNISFRTRIKVDRTFFMPDEYEILREFYNMIVKKQAEQIVFKKKK